MKHLTNSRVFRNALQLIAINKYDWNAFRRIPMRYVSSEASESGVDWQSSMGASQYQSLPVIVNRPLNHLNNVNTNLMPIREVWMENMSSIDAIKLAIIQLHPQIFGAFPRMDTIQDNHRWQKTYKFVDWTCMPTREELQGSNRKPWPQKGTGRARARTTRAPNWIKGGWSHGPRGPRSFYYMLNFTTRLNGLITMLTVKLAQDDLKLVDTLETLPSDDPKYIEDLCDKRGWGPSVLFVDSSDIFPKNISLATETIKHINLMPVYGLNVFSMLKHETLVLTLAATEEIEQKLLFNLRRTDLKDANMKGKARGVLQI